MARLLPWKLLTRSASFKTYVIRNFVWILIFKNLKISQAQTRPLNLVANLTQGQHRNLPLKFKTIVGGSLQGAVEGKSPATEIQSNRKLAISGSLQI